MASSLRGRTRAELAVALATGGPLVSERVEDLVRATGRSERTLRRLHAEGVRLLKGGRAPTSGRVGRPAHPPALRGAARALVQRLLEVKGWALGEPAAMRELIAEGIEVPVRAVREALSVLKAERKRHL